MLLKDFKNLNKYGKVPCSQVRKWIILKVSIAKKEKKSVNWPPELIYRINTIPFKIPPKFLLEKLMLRFIWKKKVKDSQGTAMEEKLVGEQGAGKHDLPDSKNYFKIISIKAEDLAVK